MGPPLRFHNRWEGDSLLATLKSRSLYRLRMEKGVVQYVESLWIGEQIRDLLELPLWLARTVD